MDFKRERQSFNPNSISLGMVTLNSHFKYNTLYISTDQRIKRNKIVNTNSNN